MTLHNVFKEHLEELEKTLVKKDAWYKNTDNAEFLKFHSIVFTMDGEISAKFEVYNFYDGMEPQNFKIIPYQRLYKAFEVEEDFVNDHIAHVAQLKLLTVERGER